MGSIDAARRAGIMQAAAAQAMRGGDGREDERALEYCFASSG